MDGYIQPLETKIRNPWLKTMEHFFEEQLNGDVLWYNNYHEAPVASQSAFVPYKPGTESGTENVKKGRDTKSSNKRMIEFLKRSWSATREPDRERGQRHMINERMRRGKEKQYYLALHSVLPRRTKNDKNTIVQTAAKTIQELQCHKRELEKRNYEIEAKMGMDDVGGTKIRVNICNPISGVDSILELLKCLKKLGSRIKSIQSQFSDQRLTAVIDTETQMAAAEVENAVQTALQEVERKLLFNYQEC